VAEAGSPRSLGHLDAHVWHLGWTDLDPWLGAGTAGFLRCISYLKVVSPAQWLQGSWISYTVAKAPKADVLRQGEPGGNHIGWRQKLSDKDSGAGKSLCEISLIPVLDGVKFPPALLWVLSF